MARPSVPVEVSKRFWEGVREGLCVDDASAGAGVSQATGWRWFGSRGGVLPSCSSTAEPSGLRLSFAEREEIACLAAAGHSARSIARELGRAPSTITRELSLRRSPDGRYRASTAQAAADASARRPKPAKLAINARLRVEVQARLELHHSPEQIMRRLREDFPDDPEMWVSHEAIYQSLFVQSRGALRRELTTCLRTGRALRRPRRQAAGTRAARTRRIPDMVNISERPAEVADRAVPGHWEGDLIVGKDSGSAIGTLVERTTRFVLLLHLPPRPDGQPDHGALAVQEAMTAKMSELPDQLLRTLTWDQGIEMTNHARIAAATGLDIYFCDPHSPWQRGSNENTNGLLRQYFPKGTDLSRWGAGYLDNIAAELNNRPRKTLDWRTPAEALDKLLSNPSDPPGVATTS
jgi:transposase, IS30 family